MPKAANSLHTRSVAVRGPETFNKETNSVRAVATTEKPARVFSYDVYDYVDEVLRSDGAVLPKSGQVPLLDSHSRYSVKHVLGSARDFQPSEVEGFRGLDCDVSYSETEEGASAAQKTREGHLTDYSVGYKVLESYWVPDGKKQIIGGDEYEGPVSVVTKYEIRELSATPIGADEYAKARSLHLQEETPMPGRAKDDNNNPTPAAPQAPAPQQPDQGRTAPTSPQPEQTRGISEEEAEQIRKDAIEQERTRSETIRSRCAVAGIDEETTNDFITRGLSPEQASEVIFTRMEKNNPPVGAGRVHLEADETDKYRAAAVDGISMRSGVTVEKPAPGHEEFRGRSLLRIAEDCLVRSGASVRGISKRDLAAAAMGIGRRSIGGSSTSDFPLLMSEVANRHMVRSYEEASVTWDMWCNVVDASDFKPMQGIDISTLNELALLNERGEYKDVSLDETGESYMVKTFGNKFTLSRQMIINDDLRVFLRIPQMFGSAARRTVNSHVYSLLSKNITMRDGSKMFAAGRKNLVAGEFAKLPDNESLSEGRRLMRKQKDPGGKATLNLTPKYLIAGSKHENNIDVILASSALPLADMSSGVTNPWKGRLVPIIDATLDNYDEDAWYLAPEKSAADVIEVAFLDGEQHPYLEDREDFDSDGIKYKCRIDFGVGAMSSRMIKNPGK